MPYGVSAYGNNPYGGAGGVAQPPNIDINVLVVTPIPVITGAVSDHNALSGNITTTPPVFSIISVLEHNTLNANLVTPLNYEIINLGVLSYSSLYSDIQVNATEIINIPVTQQPGVIQNNSIEFIEISPIIQHLMFNDVQYYDNVIQPIQHQSYGGGGSAPMRPGRIQDFYTPVHEVPKTKKVEKEVETFTVVVRYKNKKYVSVYGIPVATEISIFAEPTNVHNRNVVSTAPTRIKNKMVILNKYTKTNIGSYDE